jgi:membrane-bound lytic murein transglycosylase B
VQGGRGVDEHLLAALVGVETFFGRNAGKTPTFGALYTISLRVPRRSDWAARELAELLRLCAPQGVDPHSISGSYAGAFGLAQFMPSSFVAYAVDQDGDGRKRWDEWPDMLGSAANYLVRHGYAGAAFVPSSPIGRSIYAYNHSENYVKVVLELRAELLARAP